MDAYLPHLYSTTACEVRGQERRLTTLGQAAELLLWGVIIS